MSCKKFDKFPADFHWKDMTGFLSLLVGLFLATVSLNNKDQNLQKQESVVSIAEKGLQNLVIPKTHPKEGDKDFVGPLEPSQQQASEKKSPLQQVIKKVFNNKYSAN